MSNSLDWNGILKRLFFLYGVTTQDDLGKKFDVSQDLISKWKRGITRPTWDLIASVVQEKGVSWEWLLTGKSGNMRELVNTYAALPESQILDEAAYVWAKGEVLSSVLDTKQAMKGCGDFQVEDKLEIANRLFFAATHKTDLDVSGQIYGDVEMTGYVHGPLVLALLQKSGYDHSYRFAYEVAKNALRDCSELDFLYPLVIPAPNATRLSSATEWPVRGRAAADESNGTRVPDTDESDDSISPPEGLTAVPVIGDSMSPVILDGQYALVDREREGFEVDGGIVVASICEPATDDERAETMTGTFVKRCYDGGNGLYYFASINEYSPFSAWRDHCRVWPVIGVWFAGKGKPPTEG